MIATHVQEVSGQCSQKVEIELSIPANSVLEA